MMDESFDEMTVPDDWIDIITERKRSHDESDEEECSSSKQVKHDIEPNCQSTDASESSDKEIHSSENNVKTGEFTSPIHHSTDEINTNEHGDIQSDLDDRIWTCDSGASTPAHETCKSSQETIPLCTINDPVCDDNSLHNIIDISNSPASNRVITIPDSPCKEATHTAVLEPLNCIPIRSSDSEEDAYFTVKKIPSVVKDMNNLKNVFPYFEENQIYHMLTEDRNNKNRIEDVSIRLLDTSANTSAQNASNNRNDDFILENDIFKDVERVMQELPSADANAVYTYLESMPPSLDRVQKVVNLLRPEGIVDVFPPSNKDVPLLKKQGSSINDPALKNDPIFVEMRDIAKMFPDADRNFIYALLEANFYKPDRMAFVINEVLNGEKTETRIPEPEVINADNVKEFETTIKEETTSSSPDLQEMSLLEDVDRLLCLFPTCDPSYLYSKLELMKANTDRCQILAAELFDKNDYPKAKQNETISVPKPIKTDFTVEEFLEKFPDPDKTFSSEEDVVSFDYFNNALSILSNEFRMLKKAYIREVLEKHKSHLLPSYREISAGLLAIPIAERKKHGRFMKHNRLRSDNAIPFHMPTQYLLHELWYSRFELKVKDYLKQKELDRQTKFNQAKENGELYECCCCYDDECLFEDLASCPEGHLFCKVCVLRSTEAAFGEMKNKFPCLTGECDQYLPLSTLQSIVPANLFSKIVSRVQEEEVLQANIPDLVTCPFCPFATIMPNQEDKVLKCLNPQCLKESCRLCQEESHIPLKCHEVESKEGRSMRTFIENYIAEAVIRKCHKCGKKFVKDSGCNKMTCVCRATSCYACKAQDIDYNHFNSNIRCANTDPETIHQRDMEEAAIAAKNKYILDHPEAADIELDSDFDKWIRNLSAKAQEQPLMINEQHDEDDYVGSSEEDEY